MAKRLIRITLIYFSALFVMFLMDRYINIPDSAYVIKTPWEMNSLKFSNTVVVDNTFSFSFNDLEKSGAGIYSIETTFYLKETIVNQFLVVPQPPGQGYLVYLDDVFLGKVGDIEQGKSNIWNKSGVFHVYQPLAPGFHSLKLVFYTEDWLELTMSPYIMDINRSSLGYIFYIFLTRNLGSFSMGITFVICLIFFSSGFGGFGNRTNDFSLAAAFWLLSIFLVYLVPIEYIFIDYLSFKKMIISCYSLGLLLTMFVLIRSFYNVGVKFNIFYTFYMLLTLCLVLFPPTHESFSLARRVAYLTPILPALALIKPTILNKKKISDYFIIAGFAFGLVFSIRYFYYDINPAPHTYLFGLGCFIALVFICIYFVSNYMDSIKRVSHETMRADHYFNKSVIDPLTGINNRHILDYINMNSECFTLMICDLDNFKLINDTFGHKSGDEVLKRVASIIKSNTRESDYVIRFGGDEFLIVLIGCSRDVGERVVGKIWDEIAATEVYSGESTIKISCSGGGVISCKGEDFSSALHRADSVLYSIKDSNKGRFKLIN